MGKFSAWFFGDDVVERDAMEQGYVTAQPSETAAKFAKVIEASGDRWAFEDDQGHAHSYDLGITVAFDPVIVWQGSRDEHVRNTALELLRTKKGSADSAHIANALKARRIRYNQAIVEKAQRATEEARIAREQRATEALEKLQRGECLEDPDANRYGLGGLGQGQMAGGLSDFNAMAREYARSRRS